MTSLNSYIKQWEQQQRMLERAMTAFDTSKIAGSFSAVERAMTAFDTSNRIEEQLISPMIESLSKNSKLYKYGAGVIVLDSVFQDLEKEVKVSEILSENESIEEVRKWLIEIINACLEQLGKLGQSWNVLQSNYTIAMIISLLSIASSIITIILCKRKPIEIHHHHHHHHHYQSNIDEKEIIVRTVEEKK